MPDIQVTVISPDSVLSVGEQPKPRGTIVTDLPGSGLTLVDTQGTLMRAALGSARVSGDWQNEIHPRGVGYAKLAAVWRPVLEKALSA